MTWLISQTSLYGTSLYQIWQLCYITHYVMLIQHLPYFYKSRSGKPVYHIGKKAPADTYIALHSCTMSSPMLRLIELLGLPATATTADIKSAYRKKALQFHPDKGGDLEKMKELNSLMEEFRSSQSLHAEETLDSDDEDLGASPPKDSGYGTFENVSVPDIDGAYARLKELKQCMQTFFNLSERRKQDVRPEYLAMRRAFANVPWDLFEDLFNQDVF